MNEKKELQFFSIYTIKSLSDIIMIKHRFSLILKERNHKKYKRMNQNT